MNTEQGFRLNIINGYARRCVRALPVLFVALPSPTVPSVTQKAPYGEVVPQVDISGVGSGSVLRDSPEPDRPVRVSWPEIALGFDNMAFSLVRNAQGTAPSIGRTFVNGITRPEARASVSTLTMCTTVARALIPEGVVSIGALVGGTFAGFDYSNKVVPDKTAPVNLVRLAKKYFASASGANVFLDDIPSVGGGQFWYDVLPNVLACQLAEQYGALAELGASQGEPTLRSLCMRATDTWYDVADHLRAGRSFRFAYAAVQLVDGRAVNGRRWLANFSRSNTAGRRHGILTSI